MNPKLVRDKMREASYELADSRRMCCHADLELIDNVLNMMHGYAKDLEMSVLQLGAGSGTMALMIMSNHHTKMLITIDHDPQALNWERQVLENCGWMASVNENGHPGMPYYQCILAESADPGFSAEYDLYKPDLIIFDADHSYESVKRDLEFWQPMAAERASFMLHDYDGTKAPQQYPGVKQAADEFFGRDPNVVRGWSGIFFNDVRKT